MTNDLGPGFCWTCGQPFTTSAALDAHQLATGHEMDQEDHPLRQPAAASPDGPKKTHTKISPRTGEYENDPHHFWTRNINGTAFFFVHVKVSRLGQPYIGVSRLDTGELVRCSCPRPDCPFAA